MTSEEGSGADLERGWDSLGASLKLTLPALGAYAVGIGLVYLTVYWAHFQVNPLEHAGWTDIVATALYPLLAAGLATVLGALITGFISLRKQHKPTPAVAPARHARLLGVLFSGTIAVAVCAVLARVLDYPEYLLGLLLFVVPVSVGLEAETTLDRFARPSRGRKILVLLLLALPVLAVIVGAWEAVAVRESPPRCRVELDTADGVTGAADDERYKYVGRLGGSVFLLSADNAQLYLIATDRIGRIRFERESGE